MRNIVFGINYTIRIIRDLFLSKNLIGGFSSRYNYFYLSPHWKKKKKENYTKVHYSAKNRATKIDVQYSVILLYTSTVQLYTHTNVKKIIHHDT